MSKYDSKPTPINFDFTSEDWMEQAACIGHNPAWWFWDENTDRDTKHSAVAICKSCPVRVACLDYALKTNSSYGIWGAMTENARKTIKGNSDAA